MKKLDVFKNTEGVLYNYSTLKAEINNITLDIEELEDNYDGISSIGYEEKTGPTNKINDSVSDEIIRREKTLNKLKHIKRSKERLLLKINNALDSLDETERKFIQCRYLNGKKMSWNQVGAMLNLDPNYLCSYVRPEVINKLSCLIYFSQKEYL